MLTDVSKKKKLSLLPFIFFLSQFYQFDLYHYFSFDELTWESHCILLKNKKKKRKKKKKKNRKNLKERIELFLFFIFFLKRVELSKKKGVKKKERGVEENESKNLTTITF